MSDRPVINFGAGPSKLPTEVLQEVQKELLDYQNYGMSVMEMSHRGKVYSDINSKAQQAVRDLLDVPDDYAVLFMQGGATGIFAAVALNLLGRTGTADYFVTGVWSAKAAKEAQKYGKVNLVLPKTEKYVGVTDQSTWKLDQNASYVYYCDNETVNGVEFPFIPDTKGVPIVADMSSNMFTRPFDIRRFAVVFAGAQKNIGPPGVVLVIIKREFLGKPMAICPTVFDFTIMDKDNSLHNTPPTFAIFVMWRVFEWIKRNGGLEGMQELSRKKSTLIYDIVDQSNGFYDCPVHKEFRSRANVPFTIPGHPELEAEFLKEAEKLKMQQLKGHRLVGGIRASLYNAITVGEVKILADFMKSFRNKHAK